MLALRLSARNSGIKKKTDDVHWNVWTNIKKLYAKIIFSKKEFEICDFEMFLERTALERLASVLFFFLIFRRRPTVMADIFIQLPHQKKLPMALNLLLFPYLHFV